MKLKPNTSYVVVKDFFLWGVFSAVQMVEGETVYTLDESENETITVKSHTVSSDWAIYTEVYKDNNYEGMLEEF